MKKHIINDIEKFSQIPELGRAITFFGSARFEPDNVYFKQARELARICVGLGFCVISGGGGGIMRAANEGAFTAPRSAPRSATGSSTGSPTGTFPAEETTPGSATPPRSVGFNILLPHEQRLNDFVEYSLTFEGMAIRKCALIEKSAAFIIFPGGFGTLDELGEILTLKQLEFKGHVPIILFGRAFWQGFDDFVRGSLLAEEVISAGDEKSYEITDDLGEISRILKELK